MGYPESLRAILSLEGRESRVDSKTRLQESGLLNVDFASIVLKIFCFDFQIIELSESKSVYHESPNIKMKMATSKESRRLVTNVSKHKEGPGNG